MKNMKTVSYKPLFKMLVDRDIWKSQLRDMCGYSTAVATKLNKNIEVSMSVLIKICNTYNCDISDICETTIIDWKI